MKRKFSLHPWVYASGLILDARGNVVAVRKANTHRDGDPKFGTGIGPAEADRNAKLMTKAPEMLGALKEMLALFEDVWSSNAPGKMCFQDYGRLNTAPGVAERLIKELEDA